MNTTKFDKKMSKEMKNKKRFSKTTSFIILGTLIAVLIGIGTFAFSETSTTEVSAQSPLDRKGDKKYVATRNIIIDRETGRARKPNAEELAELVKTLETLTKRSDENLPSVSLSNGGVGLDLDGGFGGTILARPTADGTMETRCVFTIEEATEFLGLVEENL